MQPNNNCTDHNNTICISLLPRGCNFRGGEFQDEKYDHIELAEMEKVKNAALDKHSWLEKNVGLCNQQPTYADPVVTIAEVNAQREV